MQVLLQKVFSDKYNDQNYLKEIIEEYPFFTLAHIGLLQQINKNERSYENHLAKTALLFNNPHLLHFSLNNKVNTPIPELEKEMPLIGEERINVSESVTESTPETHFETIVPEIKKEEALFFEPLYTTDYFASQGIKLSEEIKANDKLGRQMKSFTEWLKTMKKLHPTQKMEHIAIDTTVEKLAEKSNEEGEVITEAMAEVYENQGKYKKAKEIYQKLSLQNPAKSAFFAAKLEQIKDH